MEFTLDHRLNLSISHTKANVDKTSLDKLYRTNLTIQEIAALFGCSVTLIRTRLRLYAITLRQKNELHRKQIDKELIRNYYYDDGLTTRQIGKIVGCDSSHICNLMKEYGLRARCKNDREYPITSSKYLAIHTWLRRHKPKPEKCEICNINLSKEIANIVDARFTGNYTRNLSDYIWSCVSCHRKLDKNWIKRSDKNVGLDIKN